MAPKYPTPFAPSAHLPEKRSHQVNLRFTDSERALLDAEATKRGVTTLNLIRILLTEGLSRSKKRR